MITRTYLVNKYVYWKSKIWEAKRTLFMYLCRFIPIDNHKVVFMSYQGKGFNDNPRAIFEEMSKRRPHWKYVWLLNDTKTNINNAQIVKAYSYEALYQLATAKIWIDNMRKERYIVKRRKQYYVQTWHGNLGNKRIEAAAKNLSKGYILSAKKDSKLADLIISGSSFFTKIVKKYFWYEGEIFECGSPRLDIFFRDHNEIISKVRKILDIDGEKKLLLYAPTFRDSDDLSYYEINQNAVILNFEKLYNCECVLLIRLHPNVAEKQEFISENNKVINVTDYQDLYELLIACDVVISDYSSLMFEAGLLYKPVFQYVRDINEYQVQRGFWIDPHKLPFVMASNEEELLNAINSFDYELYQKKLIEFYNHLGIKENGYASKQLVDRIIDIVEKHSFNCIC